MGTGDQHLGDGGFGSHPPLPQLTLRVGITGHRLKPAKLPPESFAFVRKRLVEVFDAVDQALTGVLTRQGKCFSGGPVVRLVSGLAEGADQLAVEVMPEKWTLDAVLPFPRAEYLKDFGEQASADGKTARQQYQACLDRPNTTVTELPGERLPRSGDAHHAGEESDPGYARLGGFLLRQVDILIAVWDGKPGDKGGTGEVVRAAKGAAIPIIWIDSLHDRTARMVERVDGEGEGFPSDADCCSGPLRNAIEIIVGFPRNPAPDSGEGGRPKPLMTIASFLRKRRPAPVSGDEDVPDRLRDYLAEKWPSPSFSLYDAFKRLARRNHSVGGAETHRAGWALALQGNGPNGPLNGRLETVLLRRYEWADALAIFYSNRYRSAYFLCYLLAAFAVTIALLGVVAHETKALKPWFLHAKAFLVFIELLLIVKIMSVVSRGRGERWQEKWIEYRSLAELLFNVRFLSYLAEHGRTQRISKLATSSEGWLLWYLAATIREVGLPNAHLNGDYQGAVLAALDSHVVRPQRQWHDENADTLHRMHHILHLAGEICFGLTVFLLVLFLLLYLYIWTHLPGAGSIECLLEHNAHWVTVLAALLPAFGAAVASIRTTGDFDKVALRSHKTAAALGVLIPDIDEARQNPELDETGDVLLRTAQVLAEDLDSWHLVYGDKRLELPS